MSPLITMSVALVLNTIGFANYAAVLPQVRAGVGISESQAGIAGGIFFLAYALGSPVFSALTDVRSPRRLYIIGALFGIFGGLIFPLIDGSFPSLLASRVLTGLGMAGTYMPGLRLLIETLPPDRQRSGAGIYVSALTLGLSASFGLSGALDLVFGWSAAFIGAASCAALALLVVYGSMPSPLVARESVSVLSRFSAVIGRNGVASTLAAMAGNSWEGMAFRTWWIALLTFSSTGPGSGYFKGVNLAIATAFTGLLAMPLSAFVAKRAESRGRYAVIACAAASSAIVSIALAAVVGSSFIVVFLVSIVYVCTIFSDAGALTAGLLVRVPVAERGAALALQSIATNCGACIAVAFCGFVLQSAGGAASAFAWQITILTIGAGSAVTAATMFFLHRQFSGTRMQGPSAS
ncbi:MFS transporter [Bradyrhizobium sp. USDA 4502]